VWEVLVDSKRKDKAATLVHPFVRLDREREVQDIVRVRKVCLHCTAQRQFSEICKDPSASAVKDGDCDTTHLSVPAAGQLLPFSSLVPRPVLPRSSAAPVSVVVLARLARCASHPDSP
jgi:hypothetical protein